MKYFTVIGALLFCIIPRSYSQNGNVQYFFERYYIANGFSDNTVEDILKDRRGFLWIATANGLNRYDGYEFRKYFHNPNDSSSIPSSWAITLTEDKNGFLWIGFSRGGIAKYDHRTDTFIQLDLWFEDGHESINDIFCDSKNRLWVATPKGHYLYENSGKLIKHWRADNKPGSIPSDRVVHTYQDGKGRIWVGTSRGFCLFDEKKRGFVWYEDHNPSYTRKEGNNWVNNSQEPTEDEKGNFWFGGWATGLKRFNPQTGAFQGWLPSAEFKGQGAFNIISAQQFYGGRLWVASHDKGLGIFDTVSHTFSFVKDWGMAGTEPLHRQVTDLYLTDGVLWIGGGSGLFKLDLRPRFFDVFKLNGLRFGSCLPDLRKGCAIPGNPTTLLLPTWTCGVYEYDIESGHMEPVYYNIKNEAKAYTRLDVKKIMYDSRNVLWMATHDGIVRVEDGDELQIQPFPVVFDSVLHMENYSMSVMEDTEGNVWVATLNGILLFKDGKKEFTKYQPGELGTPQKLTERIGDISLAPNGDVWFLHHEGGKEEGIGFTVYDKRAKTFRTFPLSRKKKASSFGRSEMTIDPNGMVWVTTENGLVVFHSMHPERTALITSSDGLISDNCHSPTVDAQGNIWVASHTGLSLIDPKTFSIRNITVGNGLPDADITSLFKTGEGTLYVGFQKEWLAVLRPERIKALGKDVVLSVVSIQVGDEEIGANDTLSVANDFGFIRIKYSPLNFLPQNYNTYHIRITGAGNITEYITELNEITLSGLAPGYHSVNIYTENKFTGEKSLPVETHIYVKPAFWQTLWFKMGVGLLLLLVPGLVLWYRFMTLRRIQRKEIEMNKRIAETEMDALKSQMNPHFVFNALNAIHRFIWDKKPGEASEYLTKFARLIRMVLENSRQKWIPISDDMRALEYYIQLESLHLEHGLLYSVVIDDDIDSEITLVPPLILQPFVENAIKHGFYGKKEKGELLVFVRRENAELCCVIEDNGKGRGTHGQSGHKSLGTTITSDRLEIINYLNGNNARFTYEDKTDTEGKATGTLVRLYLPLVYDH